nr:hypothetical protein [Tanacetum cinerariifolium]
KPTKAKRFKRNISRKTRQPRSSPKSVGASEAEEVPAKEPQVADEDADYQKAVEESTKVAFALPKGPLPPVVIREPVSGKYQPLPEVPGKGKAKVTEERDSKPTESSFYDESPYDVLGQSDSEEESEKTGSDVGAQAVGQAGSNPDETSKGQAGSNPDETSKGQAGSNPDETSEGQAGPDLCDAKARVQSISSPMVHAGSDREHMDLDVADVSPQPSTKQLDEGFTATVYPNVQENLKHAINEPVLLEEPASSSRTLSSLQHLTLEKSMNRDHSEELAQDLAEARKKKKKGRESPKTPPGSPSHQPPPSPPPAGPSGASVAPRASRSQVISTPPLPTSTSQDNIRSAHISTVNLRQDWWKPFEEERPTTLEPAWLIRSSDVPVLTNNWASALASNYSPPPEDLATHADGDIATFMDWFCKRRGITKLKPQDLEGPAYEIVKVFHLDVIHLQYQMEECHKLLTDGVDDPILRHNDSKPLPLGGPPGQVTIQSDFFFNKDLEYLRYGSKGCRPALSISKMKATYYPDAGIEQMVPDQFWIEEECKYDIAAMYGISYWWFQRQRFYINRHTSEGDRNVIRTHM